MIVGRPKYNWPKVVKDLRANPGTWAIVVKAGEAPSKRAAQDVSRFIRKGSKYMPKGEFDAVTRDDQVYAIYKGGQDAETT